MNTPPVPTGSARPARVTPVVAGMAAVCLLAVGCSGSGSDGSDSAQGAAGAGTARSRVALITHGAKGDVFWERVQKGARAAAAKDHIELTYASDPDATAQADLVRDAVKEKVDGIAVTLAKPDAMKGAVLQARAAGIPVVGLNSGIGSWRSTGLLAFFGQDESTAGRALGAKLDALGARHALCVIHEQGNVGLEARCAGARKTFTGETDTVYVDGTDLDAVTAVVAAKLNQDPSIDEVVTLGAQFALSAVKAVEQTKSRAKIATFDLNNDIVGAVRNGRVQFAVDQQPYLQGYLAVDSLWLYRSNGNFSGGGSAPVLTGPAFVTRHNIADVARFASEGTR
ncbi:substrate-binding domain-containing protein [Streptomyces graminilatus]|uniref:substrate-binding domain-containing protein n=1 Tax=Streptomyces graminilatus TaxID=1464070 RepID=UPI0006E35357|nr:substrate-binding domain-containing protein [Streptomyces graminilatus]